MLKRDFTKAAKKAEGMSDNAFLDAILDERPDLAREMAYVPEQGQCAHVVMIGDEVFKTARFVDEETQGLRRYVVGGVAREHNVLEHFKGKGLPLPEVKWTSKDSLSFSMTRMEGQALDPDDLETMTKADRQKLAKGIATLCVQLSDGVTAAEAKKMGVDEPLPGITFEPDRFRAELARSEVQEVLAGDYGFYKQAVEQYIEQHEKKYADGKKYFMHADFNPGNIFYKPETKEFCGLIDYGNSRMTWPEEGFAVLTMVYPKEFTDMILEEYSRQQPVQVTQKDLMLWMCVRILINISDVLKWDQNEDYLNILKGVIPHIRRQTEPLLQENGSPPQVQPRDRFPKAA